MTRFGHNLMALASAGLLASGCAYGNAMTEVGDFEPDRAADDRAVVRVANNNWADMTIYLVHSGARRRLGTVTSQSTQRFVVPAHLMTSSTNVYLVADPIGSSRTFRSAPILINPGQTAEWQLENSLSLSSMWVR